MKSCLLTSTARQGLLCLLLMLSSIVGRAQPAQPTIYADLAGEWRISQDDQPRYALPATDDRAWNTARLPWQQDRPIGVYWLRRSIGIPPGANTSGLVLALGRVGESYQLYVNGSLIATTPGFGESDQPFFRPRTFPLPEQSLRSNTIVVAIRIWRPRQLVWIRQSYSDDLGPYQLAPARAALESVENVNYRAIVRSLGNLFSGAISFSAAIYLLLVYRTSRDWPGILWLGAFCLSVSFLACFPTALDSGTVASWMWFNILRDANVAFNLAMVVEFSIAVFKVDSRWRWLAWATIPLVFLQQIFANSLPSPIIVPTGCCVFFGIREIYRTRDRSIRLTAALITIYGILRINYYLSVSKLYSLPVEIALGPLRLSVIAVATTGIAGALVFLTLQRLLRDKNEKQRLTSELEAARVVQQLLLARAGHASGEYTVEAIYAPSQEVGGDFYCTLKAEDESFLLAVGDVSGKGLKAAMSVSLLIGALRETRERRPGGVLRALNAVVAGQPDGGFVTCCCARFDRGGIVSIANAGHLAPYRGCGEVELESGLPLGLEVDWDAPETSLQLAPGEQIALVSDGVVEASNAKGELFGFDRTREIGGKPAAEISAAAQIWGQNDDITVVTVRRRL